MFVCSPIRLWTHCCVAEAHFATEAARECGGQTNMAVFLCLWARDAAEHAAVDWLSFCCLCCAQGDNNFVMLPSRPHLSGCWV